MWQLILGPIVGFLGSTVQKYFEQKEKAADRAHELAIMDREADYADRRLKVEQEMAVEKADAAAFGASYRYANDQLLPAGQKLTRGQTWLALLIDAFTKLIRPATTTWYQVAVAGVFAWCAWKVGGKIDQAVASQIMKEVIFSIIGLAETTLLWWYGIRGMSKRGQR